MLVCRIDYVIMKEPFKSLQTLDKYDQLHNDIKPENFLVKFKNGFTRDDPTKNDLTNIEIVLTDFGLADSKSKGGTPVYASPECLEKRIRNPTSFHLAGLFYSYCLKRLNL